MAARWRALPRLSYHGDTDVKEFEADTMPGPWMSGERFLASSRQIRQVINGRFEGILEGSHDTPWVILRAVDSSWWEVYSDDPAVEAGIRHSFRDVRPARYVAEDDQV